MTVLVKCVKADAGFAAMGACSADLVVADPPYFRVANEKWDRQWRTMDEYVAWSMEWLRAAFHAMRPGATLYLFGYMKVLAHLIPGACAMGFEYREEITIDKGMKSVAGRATRKYKIFPNVTETIVMLVKDPKPTIKSILLEAASRRGLTPKQINIALGVKSNGGGMWSIYTGENILGQTPTAKAWRRLCDVLGVEVRHSKIAQTFNAQPGHTNVWSDINFAIPNRTHTAQKPDELIERIVLASSNPGDFVVDAFAGSGVTSKVCRRHGRCSIAFETDEKLCADLRRELAL